MPINTEVARVEGSMRNLGYKFRGLYTERYFNDRITLSAKTIDLNQSQSLVSIIEELQMYAKAEKITLRKRLRE